MIRVILLCAAIVCASVGGNNKTDNTNNVAKREILEFYPDWVPFKNKHGDELGEFVDVTKPKAKVKKRLALPMNFLIKSLTDDDSGDYIGQGESDSDDYYDKKDWSDLYRPESNASKPSDNQPVTESAIDGVINIITKPSLSLADDIIKSTRKEEYVSQDDYEIPEKKENLTELVEQYTTTSTPEIELKIVHTPIPIVYKNDEDDSEPVNNQQQAEAESQKLSSEEQRENEEKKRVILDSVDQLKMRHEDEQRAISAKNKQDEYNNKLRHKKRNHKRKRTRPTPPNYDEYENFSWDNKYNVNVEKKATTPEDLDVTTTEKRRVRVRISTTTMKPIDPGQAKYSLFRNPNLYTIDGDEDETSPLKKTPNTPRRFSSKYNIAASQNLITPATTTEKVEPILYFPKRKLRKSKLRTTTTTIAPDSSVAETVEDKLSTAGATVTEPTTAFANDDYRTTAVDYTYPTSTISLWKNVDSDVDQNNSKRHMEPVGDTTSSDQISTTGNEETSATANDLNETTGPSGEAQASNSDTVTDAVPASSDTKEKEPKDYHVEKGGGKEHHSSFEEEHEEHGKKAYEGLHKDSKTKKGHHDKEDHLGKYEDHGGHDKEHHDESGHYGAHHHEEHGKKQAKYEESGKHSKGHSTKGSHDIHKKEEYEKNVEFFEEEGDSAEEEKHGGYHNEKRHESGGNFKKGKLHNDHHENKKGESGHFVKGGHGFLNKGHKTAEGQEGHGKRHGAHHDAGGHQTGKKWLYHHGFPAKNANLVVIDRRTDRYMHGPNYFG